MNKDTLKSNIKMIRLEFPNNAECQYEQYKVGESGVTKINEAQRYAEYSMINYYEIYKGEFHWRDIHAFSTVEYFEETNG